MTDRVLYTIIAALFVALCVSLGLNFFASAAYLKQRDALTQAAADLQAARDDSITARAAAQACSASIDDLQAKASALAVERDTARKQAQAKAATHYARADAALTAAPAVPGDACASAATRAQSWLVGRMKGGG